MKKVLASFICTIVFFLLGFSTLEAGCVTQCSHQGCNVTLTQYDDSWELEISCSDGYSGEDSGQGQYGGTVCGGTLPQQC